MNATRKLLTAVAASGLLMSAMTAAAADTSSTSTITQSITASSGGFSTDATDRGGRPAPKGETQSTISILDWLRGLMD
ncbi:MAG: hypothetical protein AB8G17_05675 [Gammaproteobacteria bacterium]